MAMVLTAKRLASVAAASSLFLIGSPGMAGLDQAICSGESECAVTLANGVIPMPGQVIKKDQVLSWSQSDSGSKTDVGMGVAGVILFGLPGLIGFAAKKHDYAFPINDANEARNIQLASVDFTNNVPANQFMMERLGMTGLSMGKMNVPLQARIKVIPSEAGEKARIAALNCAGIVKTYSCSWSAYLDAKSAARTWASKHPNMVSSEKVRLGAID